MEVPNWAAGLSICRRRRRRFRRRITQAGAGPKYQLSARGIIWLSRTRPLIAASATANRTMGARFAPAASTTSAIRIASRWRLAGCGCRLAGTREIRAFTASASRAERAAAASTVTIKTASRRPLAGRGRGVPPGTREIVAPGAPNWRAVQCGPSFRLTSLKHRSYSAVASWPAAAGSSCASGRFRRFPVDVDEFEPEVLDSPQQAVQGRLVGSGAPQHCRIAHHAHLRVVEDTPHPGTRDTTDGDDVGTIGHISRLCHSCREPPDGVSCLHPFRVGRPVVGGGQG